MSTRSNEVNWSHLQNLSDTKCKRILIPGPFLGPKLFWTRPNWFRQVQDVLDQTKNNFSLLNFTF